MRKKKKIKTLPLAIVQICGSVPTVGTTCK